MKFFLSLIVLGLTQGLKVNHNVVFQKLDEVTTTRSRWLVTFVIDLQPYDNAINKLFMDVKNITDNTWKVISHYFEERRKFVKNFAQLGQELKLVMDTYNGITESFAEYNTLYGRRKKRSLIPFVGSALNFLFGTVTDSDLRAVQENVQVLADNQQELAHVVAESLTIINASRVEISENRHTVNQLMEGVTQLDQKLRNVSQEMQKQIYELETFISTYLQIDLVIEEVKQMIQRLTIYFEHLQLQLNMLSLGRLAPSTITPHNLRKLLTEIELRLESPLHLPGDPKKELWKFYQFLTCTTILENSRILVIVPIPLLDFNEKFEIYKVHNLPVPLVTGDSGRPAPEAMTAQYDLESTTIAVDARRTRFAFLTEAELEACSKPLIGFCAIRSAIYPMNINQFCVTALFLNNSEVIATHCQTKVKLGTVLPMAQYIMDGIWVISGHSPLQMSISCHGKGVTYQQVNPPLSLIRLNESCTATSDRLMLTPYYQQESQYQVDDKLIGWLENYAFSNITLWESFHNALPDYDPISLPKELEEIKEMPMDHLIARLRSMRFVKPEQGWAIWKYFVIGIITVTVVVILVGVGCIRYKKKTSSWFGSILSRLRKGEREVTMPTLTSAAVQSADVNDVTRAKDSTPMLEGGVQLIPASNVVKFYPSLG